MAKKQSKKPRCVNCGDETSLGNAVGERQSLGYCLPCYRQWSSASVNRSTGEVRWADERKTINSGGTPAWLRPSSKKQDD